MAGLAPAIHALIAVTQGRRGCPAPDVGFTRHRHVKCSCRL